MEIIPCQSGEDQGLFWLSLEFFEPQPLTLLAGEDVGLACVSVCLLCASSSAFFLESSLISCCFNQDGL